MMMIDQLINLSQVTGQIIPDNWNIPDDWHMITQSLKREKHVLIPRECSTLTKFYRARIRTGYWPQSCPWALHSLLGTLHLSVGTHTQNQKLYIHSFPYVKIFYIKYQIFFMYMWYWCKCACVFIRVCMRHVEIWGWHWESSSITMHCTHWGKASPLNPEFPIRLI